MTVPISCIIPTHARAGLLSEALASVEAQTSHPAEIIVVSDLVDEETEQVCREFRAMSDIPLNLVSYSDDPGGASESRNRGASRATQDWLAFLDDDDTWEPSFLVRVLAKAREDNNPIVVAWITMFRGDARRDGPAIARGLSAADVVAVNAGTTGSNMLILSSAFQSIGGFDAGLRMKNDTDLFYRLLKSGLKYSVVSSRLVNQRKHNSGQLTGHSTARADATQQYMDKHRADLSFSDRRKLAFVMHRIRSHSARSAPARAFHLVMALMHYSPRQFRIDQRNKHDREYFTVPANASD